MRRSSPLCLWPDAVPSVAPLRVKAAKTAAFQTLLAPPPATIRPELACEDEMDIAGKVAIVTGGTGGLGGVIVDQLANVGCHVALVYQNSKELAEKRAREMSRPDARVVAFQADVSTVEGCEKLVQATLAEFGAIDILVNDAAFNQSVAFSDLDGLTDELWNKIITVNLTGPFRCIKVVAPVMKRQGSGRIINISSVAGLNPGGSSIAYAVSKSGLNHLTRCMAVALAPEILVNCVAPGLLEGTRMTENLTPQAVESARSGSLLKRAAHKEDVVEQVLTFARTDSTTGQTLVIDSGRYFH
jgi:3-oxoacyl-[acyl-carrier protein] reductase